jgi:hypothetical protein
VAWVVAVVLFVEAFGIAALNWFLGVVVDRQDMSLAGLDPDTMALSSKIGGVVFGLYFALCGLIALLIGISNRAPAGLGRVLLISAAVVHAVLGALVWGLVGWTAFVFMIAVMALIVLLLMTYDGRNGTAQAAPGSGLGDGGAPEPDAREEPQDTVPGESAGPGQITGPAPTTP